MRRRYDSRVRRVVLTSLVIAALAPQAVAAGCTLTHPLDAYDDRYGVDASVQDAGAPAGGEAGFDAPIDIPPADAGFDGPYDASPDVDSGDGCIGAPQIQQPLPNATVTSSNVTLKVTAPSCLHVLIVYLDYNEVERVDASTINGSIAVSTLGQHHLNVNGWTGSSPTAHVSPLIVFTRSQ